MTFHNYGPTLVVMNLEMFENLSTEHKKLLLDLGREAQNRVRHATESVDNFESAKKLLEPKGMTVVEAKVDLFRKVAEERIWPAYKSQFGALWDEIAAFQS
jgi:TRAP-type C4-dicarboxylate transport system substrate-binding protein